MKLKGRHYMIFKERQEQAYVASRKYCPRCKSEQLQTQSDTIIICLKCGLQYVVNVYRYNVLPLLKEARLRKQVTEGGK